MQPSTFDCCPQSNERINQFALVSYLPDPLCGFLDELRLRLVPDCNPHAHVTILPPRPLCGDADRAARELRELSRDFRQFSIRLGAVAKFEHTDVVYLEIASGCDQLHALYKKLNAGAAFFCEKFRYSPHITLAQNLPADQVAEVYEAASREWNGCPFNTEFEVNKLSFVQNTVQSKWIDLETIPLAKGASPALVSQTIEAAKHHRV